MKIKDQEMWDKYKKNNTDVYGKGIIDFAERWGDAMEQAMDAGSALADVASQSADTADTERISGFMYGAAVKTLFDVWEHGDELRRWHNLDCQIQNEGERANRDGGVLNPALVSVIDLSE